MKRALRVVAPLVSPRHRRWRQLLANLDYDPGADDDLEEPGERDFIVCGCPRTGTSLVAAQLFRPPSIVTVMEPWDGMRIPVSELFAGLRLEIAQGMLRRGRLDVDVLMTEERVQWCRDGEKPVALDVTNDFLLGVKWPAFWRYLDLLPNTRFVVCVRDPVETMASFKRSGGRLGQGLSYDLNFNREMNASLEDATGDVELRRVLMYEYINSRIIENLDRPNVFVVRYERWYDDADGLRSDLSDFLDTPIREWRVQIRSMADSRDDLSARELALIRGYCPSAEQLGYLASS